MNEELKIKITAITADAKKNLEKIKKELAEIDKESQEAKKSIKDMMAGIAKGAAAAVAAVTALVAAFVNLGKSSDEFVKAQARVNTGFEAAGSYAGQAQKTFQELYRFLGDNDTAAEASNLLAKLTTNEKELAEWTQILQGVYATFPDSLPVESLAEAANETAKTGTVTGTLADALNWAGVSEDAFNASLQATTSTQEREALIRSTLNSLYGNAAKLYEHNNAATLAMNDSQYRLNVALANAAKYITPLRTELNYLAETFLTTFAPAIEVVVLYLTAFVSILADAIAWVGSFFGVFSSGAEESKADIEGYKQAVNDYTQSLQSGFKGATGSGDQTLKTIEKIKKATMGFDELNVVSNPAAASTPSGSGGTGGTGGAIGAMPNPADYGLGGGMGIDWEGMKSDLEEVKEKIKGVLILVTSLAAAFLLGYVYLNYWGSVPGIASLLAKLRHISGILLIVAGAIMAVIGYSDAWANGIDWENLLTTLGGLALLITGIGLSFGGVIAGFTAVGAGIALVVLGIKDLVENGYSMEAVITIAVGAITALVAVIWLFNSALLANPITIIVLAIMALVATFVILWNECEGFRNFWIKIWDAIKAAFNATVEWFKTTIPKIAQWFKDAWQAIKDAWSAVGTFFKNIWQGIKDAFAAVKTWFKDTFNKAVEGIKNAFSSVAGFFQGVWNSIKNIFSNVGKVVGDAITNTIKTAINWVLSKAIGLINGFISAINSAIGIINKIPGVNIRTLSMLDVPQLATGGIVTGDTLAHIGEGGKKEAVLPLEQNTEWMDILADRINGKAPTKIVLNVDGKALGWASINNINNITKQTGNLPLVLA